MSTLFRKKTGGGAIKWTDVDELITEILGRENISLISIVGGIDSGDKIQASEHTLDASSDGSEKDGRPSTSLYLPAGPDRMVELESGKRTSENEQEESRLREEQTKNQTVISTLLGNKDIEKRTLRRYMKSI